MRETSQTISSLVDQFMGKTIQIHEIQGEYVWTCEKVRALAVSLYNGYPSDSILLRDTDDPVQTCPAATAAGANSGTAKASGLPLDGQQCITLLAAVTRGIPVRMKADGSPTETAAEIRSDMDHPDRLPDSDSANEDEEDEDAGAKGAARAHVHHIFLLAGKNSAGGRHWIPITEMLKKGAVKALLDAGNKVGIGARPRTGCSAAFGGGRERRERRVVARRGHVPAPLRRRQRRRRRASPRAQE